MTKRLPFLLACMFFVTSAFAQFGDSFRKYSEKDRKLLETKSYYTPSGNEILTPVFDRVFIKFEDGNTFQSNAAVLRGFGELKSMTEKDYISHKNLGTVDLVGNPTPTEYMDLLREIENLPQVEYVSEFYKFETGRHTTPTNQLLVGINSTADLQKIVNIIGEDNIKSIDINRFNDKMVNVVLSANAARKTLQFSNDLMQSRQFRYADPDMFTMNMYTNTNDPFVSEQWSLNNDGSIGGSIADNDMNVFEAWTVTTGSAGISVAVIDGGVDLDHPDLAANMLPGFDATGGGNGGDVGSIGDDHGTNCAGIVAAVGDNNLGVAGVAYNVSIIPIRGLVGGSGTFADLTDAINWSWQNGADISTNSYGGGTDTPGAMGDAITASVTMGRGGLGTPMLASSGNTEQAAVGAPGEYIDAIGVGAVDLCGIRVDPSGNQSCFSWNGSQGSSYGPALDVVAPGINVYSTANVGNGSTGGGDYNPFFGGTSSACPNAAGVMALILSVNPTLSYTDARQILESTTKKLTDYTFDADVPDHPNGTWNEEVGYGLVNAFDAVTLANLGPSVIIDPASQGVSAVEAEGCEPFLDYDLNIRIAGDYTGTTDPVVTVTAAGTAVEGVDFDFLSGNTATFSGGTAESIVLPIRVYNELEADPGETIEFSLALDAGDTDVILSDREDFINTTWEIIDAPEQEQLPIVDFTTSESEEPFVTLVINFDFWSNETSWQIQEQGGGAIVASGGPYGLGSAPLEEEFDIPTGDYTFTMFDSFGDGLGSGNYTLTASNGTVLASGGGNFGFEQATDFSYIRALKIGIEKGGDLFEDATCEGVTETTHIIQLSIDECVQAEADVPVDIVVDPASTAVEGVDFDFVGPTSFLFSGEMAETFQTDLVVYNDGLMEGDETVVLTLMATANETLVEIGTPNELRIIDADVPVISFEAAELTEKEADPSNCTEVSNTILIGANADGGCAMITDDLVLTATVNEASTAIEGEDFSIDVGTLTFTSMTGGGTQFFEVTLFNELVTEGAETLILDLTTTSLVSSATNVTTMTILDPDAQVAPTLLTEFNEGFEGGVLPAGWDVVDIQANDPSGAWVVSDNTDLNGNAAHFSDDPGSLAYNYSSSQGGFEWNVLLSPAFTFTGTESTLDFAYQVQGELNFDFGVLGVIPASTDISDPEAVQDAFLLSFSGNFLEQVPDGTTFSTEFGAYDIQADIGSVLAPGEAGRLAFLWLHDGSVTGNPPLAIDDVTMNNIGWGLNIETEVTAGADVPEYPLGSITERVYYYNQTDADAMFDVATSSDHGCTTVAVDNAGSGSSMFISPIADENRVDKTFAVTASTPDLGATESVGLYYTDEELSGWEAATGRSRDELQIFKVTGNAVGGVQADCLDMSNIEFFEPTVEAIGDGFVFRAETSGLDSENGFGLAPIPSATADNFIAVQNGEQVDISWANRYPGENVIQYIVTEIFADTGEERVLEYVTGGSDSYLVTDLYPNDGLNFYRLTIVYNTGERQEVDLCNDAVVRYDATSAVKVVPNPASNFATVVASDEDLRDLVAISLIDESGRVLQVQEVVSNTGVLRYTFDVSGLAVGTYFFRLDGQGESRYVSFVKAGN